MQSWYLYSILLICLFAISCESPPKEDGTSADGKINYSYLAEKVCACAQPSIELNQTLEQLKKNQQMEALMERLPEAEKTFKKVILCSENTLLNHSKEKLHAATLKKALTNQCENLAPRLRDDLIAKLPNQ
ncbi:MAG: hypothetical protein AB8G15_16640 [Saprospiraceae bacterium]